MLMSSADKIACVPHLQGYDILEDMYGAKTAAMNFVHEICKTRAKGILDGFMGTLISALSAFQVSCFALQA